MGTLGRHIERWFGPGVLVAFALAMAFGLQNQVGAETEVHGAGATFPAPLYNRWIAQYEREHDVTIVYEAIGSGGGIDAITGREVLFGASDALLNDDERGDLPAPLLEIPMVLGPVVVAYNLPGLDGDLILDGPTLAAIYLGEITSWRDPAIAALNPDLDLPDTELRVTHRADSSGTSFIFTDYLSTISDRWRDEVGTSKDPDWPAGRGGQGNDGVAQQLLVRPGGIGYIELAYAENSGLDTAILINRDGQPVEPTAASVQAAEEQTDPDETGQKVSIVDAPGPDSYPIAGYTYILVYDDLSYISDAEEREALVEFLLWALTDGQDEAEEMGYTPLPPALAEASRELVASLAE